MLDSKRLDTLHEELAGTACQSSCTISSVKPISLSSVSRKAIFFSFSIGERFSRFPLPVFVVFSYRYC